MRIFLILVMICSTACAQENKETTKISQDIYSLHKEIKKYKKEPIYKFNVTSSACSFYLLVNDIPLYKFFGESGGVSGIFPVNWNIEKSGKKRRDKDIGTTTYITIYLYRPKAGTKLEVY